MRLIDIYSYLNSNPSLWHVEHYEPIDWDMVPAEKADRTIRRYETWAAFLREKQAASAADLAGVSKAFVSKVAKLVYEQDDDGNIAGLNALIPYTDRKKHERRKAIPESTPAGYGYAGAFELLLARPYRDSSVEEVLEKFLTRCFKQLNGAPSMPEITMVHRFFKCLIRASGVQRDQYPFDTAEVAYRSVATYVNRFKVQFYAGKNFRLPNWRTKLGIDGQYRIFECSELDEHVCDQWAFAEIHQLELVWTDGVVTRFIKLTRLSIVVEVDRRSHLAIGYRVCERRRNNAEMIVDCLCSGTIPFERPDTPKSRFEFPDEPAFASELGESLHYRGRTSIKMDNDLTHYAKKTEYAASNCHAMELNFGKKGSPKGRGFIEGFFDRLEDLLRLLPGFTGKFPGDERGTRQDKVPVDESLLFDQFCEAIVIILAEHNCTPNSGLGGMSPIQFVEQNQARDNILAYFEIPEERVDACYIEFVEVTVRTKDGCPCFSKFSGDYYGGLLTEFVGKTLKARIDRRDGRIASVHSLQGELLGDCTYRGPLEHRRHHVDERAMFNRWARKDRLQRDPDTDSFARYMLENIENATDSTNAATRLLATAANVDLTTPPPQPNPTPREEPDEDYVPTNLQVKEA